MDLTTGATHFRIDCHVMRRIIAVLLLLFSAGPALGQVTFSPIPLAFPQIAIGGDEAGQNYVTLIQIINNNSATITGRISLFADNGAPLSASFDGQNPQSTLDVTLASGEARQIRLTLAGVITAGWLQAVYSPSEASTTVILQFRSGTTLLSEVGVDPFFGTFGATDFAVETNTGLNTGIAIANPSPATGFVLARLWDPATGAALANTVITLSPNGHIARFLTELFPDALNISQIRAKVSLDSCSSSTCSFAGGGMLATAIRLNGDQFTTIPVAEREDGEQTRVLPQVAFGGPAGGINMKTVLYLTTNVTTGVFGTAAIFDNDGNPLVASADGAAPASSITFTVSGNRVTRIVLSGDATLRSGWIRLTLSGNVHLVTNAIFQTFNGTNLVSEASVLESLSIKNGLIYVKSQSGAANVGIALANHEPSSNTISVDLFDRRGFVLAHRDISLNPNGHFAQFVTEIFPQLATEPDFDGALFIHSPTSFSALALRLSGDKVATLPVWAEGMFRPSITNMRITRTQRTVPAEVSFEIDLTDFDSDIAVSGSTSVAAIVLLDFGNSGSDSGDITIDGTALVNRATGTLSATFRPPRVTGAIPAGFQAVLYILLFDSLGNSSNVVAVSFRF